MLKEKLISALLTIKASPVTCIALGIPHWMAQTYSLPHIYFAKIFSPYYPFYRRTLIINYVKELFAFMFLPALGQFHKDILQFQTAQKFAFSQFI